MWFHTRSVTRRPVTRPRLQVESLESRDAPAAFTAGNVTELIADINAANVAGGANTITLKAVTTFTLTTVNNTTDGPTGLPVVAAGNRLTIIGNADTLQRKTTAATPGFRLIDVAPGASLTIQNLTLEGGASEGSGGAIINCGKLTLQSVIIQNNTAQAVGDGVDARGGGVYSDGTLALTDSTIRNNHAIGSHGLDLHAGVGGSAFGGGVYVAGGTATFTGVTLSGNTAEGGIGGSCRMSLSGDGGDGGGGFGGGVYVAAGSATLHDTTMTGNAALGAKGGAPGSSKAGPPGKKGQTGKGLGGGLDVESGATVSLDAITFQHITNNEASKKDPDVHGSYSVTS